LARCGKQERRAVCIYEYCGRNTSDRALAGPGVADRAIISSRSGAGGAMECGVAAAAGAYAARAQSAAPPAHPAHPALSPTERSPAKAGLHVNFSDKGEVKERREKFLTAKYGSHQMALIRKRLAVEMWLYDELQKLYESAEGGAGGAAGAAGGAAGGAGGAAQDVEVDIDELLDMEGDELRRRHLTTLLADARKPQKDVHKFINELLEKAKTL
ncbi:protein phosphatase 1 regulatory subunit 14B, partial [Papilio machaon]|uniref:protein phosphatase 1 regulatory subunit 14B n=1 Tax=Papilio machaon TaxID=76193 RepID=UPI001E665DB8